MGNKKFKRNAWKNAKLLQLINPKIFPLEKFDILFFHLSKKNGYLLWKIKEFYQIFFYSNRAQDILVHTSETMRAQQQRIWQF